MPQNIFVSGAGAGRHEDALEAALVQTKPRAIGIASAFVSIDGVERTISMLNRCGNPKCRLVAGIDNSITHPEALTLAQGAGWQVRLGRRAAGIFHPKLIVAGKSFSANGHIRDLSCVYVGSSNLTIGGFRKNVECGLLAEADASLTSASVAFARFWSDANIADKTALRNYSSKFAERNRKRSAAEIQALGVSDTRPVISLRAKDLLQEKPPTRSAIGIEFAVAAWAGLQSFTGEYRFQIEFPRAAGEVIRRLIGTRILSNGTVDVYCTDDGETRSMQYRFYTDNSMFRLNVQNDVPNVEWARQHKDGLALIEQGPRGGAPIRLTILMPGIEANEIVSRSVALGTWGRTTTRLYGWY